MGECHQLNTTGAGVTVSKIKAPHLKAASRLCKLQGAIQQVRL